MANSVFFFLYVGAEVSQGGWSVSYVVDVRNGNTDAGYIASGLFELVTLSRMPLTDLHRLLGSLTLTKCSNVC